jgi:hypothetical protein
MRPRISLWSDNGAPAQRQWKSSSKRGVSIGPKILLAAAVIVAGFIGISGIFPEVIDARWTPDAVARLPVMSLSAPDARTKAVGAVATTGSPPRRVTTTGQGTVLPRPAPTPDTAPPERAKAEAVAAAPQAATPLGAAEVPESQTQADALPAEAAPAPAARAAEQTKSTRMAQRAKPVVKKKVVHFAQRRSSHRDYAQYNAWGWPSSGWGSWGGWGGGYRF